MDRSDGRGSGRLLRARRGALPQALATSLAAVAALAGCGGEQTQRLQEREPPARTRTTAVAGPPALCARPLRVRVAGRVDSAAARELSGLVLSRTRPDVLWMHNDSGDDARLLATTTSGRTVADVTVAGARNVDWEDIAAGPGGTLVVGDIGDNLGQRSSVVLYRVPEPRPGVPASVGIAVSARHELRYPDGPRDAEALLVDAITGSVVIVAKSFGGEARVYVSNRPSSRRVTTLRRSGTISLATGEAVTAGDVAADGRTIAVRTHQHAYVWRRRAGETVAAALRRRPCRADASLLREGQGETLALTSDGGAFLTVPEGPDPVLRRYEASGSAPRSDE